MVLLAPAFPAARGVVDLAGKCGREVLVAHEKQGTRGFTLVELLVVIAIIAILATLLTPVINRARQQAYKTDCANNLKNLGTAAQMYSDDKKIFPWCKPLSSGSSGTLTDESEALACLELLYKYNYVDDPRVYLCKAAAGYDEESEPIDDLKERQSTFHLNSNNCSFTYRNVVTTVNDDTRTPIAADKRGPEGTSTTTNHKDGRNVLTKGNQVFFYEIEKLNDPNNRDVKRFRKELVGFQNTGGS
jgi:prepilin-type N-terminal cleavage/methylation domain-containing protein